MAASVNISGDHMNMKAVAQLIAALARMGLCGIPDLPYER